MGHVRAKVTILEAPNSNVGVILHTEFQIGVTFALINSDATIATLDLGNQNSWQH